MIMIRRKLLYLLAGCILGAIISTLILKNSIGHKLEETNRNLLSMKSDYNAAIQQIREKNHEILKLREQIEQMKRKPVTQNDKDLQKVVDYFELKPYLEKAYAMINEIKLDFRDKTFSDFKDYTILQIVSSKLHLELGRKTLHNEKVSPKYSVDFLTTYLPINVKIHRVIHRIIRGKKSKNYPTQMHFRCSAAEHPLFWKAIFKHVIPHTDPHLINEILQYLKSRNTASLSTTSPTLLLQSVFQDYIKFLELAQTRLDGHQLEDFFIVSQHIWGNIILNHGPIKFRGSSEEELQRQLLNYFVSTLSLPLNQKERLESYIKIFVNKSLKEVDEVNKYEVQEPLYLTKKMKELKTQQIFLKNSIILNELLEKIILQGKRRKVMEETTWYLLERE